MDTKEPVDLSVLATKIRHGIYSSYSATLVGGAAEVTRRQFQRMSSPQIGDLAAEQTTIYISPDIDAVGIIEEIAEEPVIFDDEEFVWDAEVEGKPHPLERVFYIRTLDGRRFRWTNANFIAAVDSI